MTVASGEIVKSVVTGTMPGEVIWQAVFYHVLTAAAPVAYSAIMSTIVAEIEAIYATMNTFIRTDATLEDVVCHAWEWDATDLWHTGRLVGVATLTDGFNNAAEMFPHAVASIVSAFTQDVKVRSRKSLPGFGEGQGANSILIPAAVAGLVNFAAEWLTERIIAGTDTLWPVVPALGGATQAILHMLITDVQGSQRQRKPGEGI